VRLLSQLNASDLKTPHVFLQQLLLQQLDDGDLLLLLCLWVQLQDQVINSLLFLPLLLSFY